MPSSDSSTALSTDVVTLNPNPLVQALGKQAEEFTRADIIRFVIEQGVPFSLEIDARDDLATTIHVLARGADDAPLAAGRLLIDPVRPGVVHLGRLAVRRACRGTGLGARMVSALEDAAWRAAAARDDGAAVTVILSAQEQAMGFYERCGYTAVTGESYLDAGIPHQDMARVVSR